MMMMMMMKNSFLNSYCQRLNCYSNTTVTTENESPPVSLTDICMLVLCRLLKATGTFQSEPLFHITQKDPEQLKIEQCTPDNAKNV